MYMFRKWSSLLCIIIYVISVISNVYQHEYGLIFFIHEAGSDHYFHTECPSVRPSVRKLQNQATITAGRDCGLAEWIIDDFCLVFFVVETFAKYGYNIEQIGFAENTNVSLKIMI